jgi:hypothetical protein
MVNRVFLRDVRSGEYYAGPDRWTSQMEEAQDFEDGLEALDASANSGREHLEIVATSGEGSVDLVVPVVWKPRKQRVKFLGT